MSDRDFRVTRVSPRRVALLQIQESDSLAAAAGTARSLGTCSSHREANGPRAFAIGPAEWLLVDYPLEDMRRRLLEDLGRAIVRVTDVSAAFVSFRVEGDMARAVLTSDVGPSWAARASRPGQYVRTRLAQADVILHCVGADAFELFADRGIAEHLEEWLAERYEAQSRPRACRSAGSRIH
jgi:heterotetrameric sarcosine oxidase gamma subunit